jgi:hypothetical protein
MGACVVSRVGLDSMEKRKLTSAEIRIRTVQNHSLLLFQLSYAGSYISGRILKVIASSGKARINLFDNILTYLSFL